MRTSSEPARESCCTCFVVAPTSAVSVFVIDCTTIGASPPTRMRPTLTCTEERRSMAMRAILRRVAAPRVQRCRAWAARTGTAIMRTARNSLSGESPALGARDAEGAISARKRSGTRTAGGGSTLPRGFWRVVARASATHRRGAARRRLISQVTGQKGGRRLTQIGQASAALFFRPVAAGEPVGRRTPLFKLHQELNARIVDFGGWDMPVQYGSQIGEHHAVRRAAGVFDVSHMCVIDLKGARVRDFLRELLANDVARLSAPGKALYSCLLNENGGVLDDLIVYFLGDAFYRLVVNAGTRDKDLAWIRAQAARFGVEVSERSDLAMLAVQGPQARAKATQL